MLGPALAAALCVVAKAPATPRSTLSGPELTYLTADGRVRIHYTLSGIDKLPDEIDEDPPNGVPDTVDYAAEGATRMLAAFVDGDGWPLPPADGGRGGDDRLDIYLRDIDANGYAYPEPYGDAVGGYVDVAPHRKVEFSKEAFESIVGHEVHHILEFTAGDGEGASWILEATATWAQYLVFNGDEQTLLAQGFLWYWRLRNGSRALDDHGHGDLFEYAGMVWLRFLVDRGGGDRKLGLALWKAIGDTGGWIPGHDAFVAAHLPGLGSLADAAAEFALWNAFACGNDDGLHYRMAPGVCAVGGRVAVDGAPIGVATTSPAIGARGAAYLDVAPDCTSGALHLDVSASTAMRVHAITVAPAGASLVATKDVAQGKPVSFDVPSWNQSARVTIVGASLGAAATFTVTPSVSGSYVPPAMLPPPREIAVTPAPTLMLDEGASVDLHAKATYGTCADGRDVTAEVTWSSSDSGVATVSGGHLVAVGPGSADITASAGDRRSNVVTLTVLTQPDAKDGSGCAIGGRGSGSLVLLAFATWLMFWARTRRPDY